MGAESEIVGIVSNDDGDCTQGDTSHSSSSKEKYSTLFLPLCFA